MVPASNSNSASDSQENSDGPLTFEKIWQLFKETDEKFKETNEKFKETDLMFKETDEKFKETSEKFKETDLMFKETDKKFKNTDKKINKLEFLFTSQWGKLVESLVEGDIIKILNEQGIEVTDTIKRRTGVREGVRYEFDIIVINGTEIVIVEVKTTLKRDDIIEFLEKLTCAKRWMPEYADKKIYGAVAFISEDSGVSVLAERKGLFVIRATGDSASIINHEGFSPKEW